MSSTVFESDRSASVEMGRLIAAARDHDDHEALGDALESMRTYLKLVAVSSLNPPERNNGMASDLVQDALVQAYCYFSQFQGTTADELRAWLFVILRNLVRSLYRSYRPTTIPIDGDHSHAGIQENLADSTATPSGHAMRGEQERFLHNAIDRLPADYRDALVLHYRDTLTYKQIGLRMGRSTEAARQLCRRGLKQLALDLLPKSVSPDET